jgi:hypothetical protein
MIDLVKFSASFKETVSGGLQKIAGAAKLADTGVQRLANNIKNNMGRTTPSVDALNKKLDDLTKTRNISVNTRQIDNLNKQIASTQKQIDRLTGGSSDRGGFSFGKMFGATALGGLAVSGIMMAGNQMLDLGRSALEQGMNAERMIVGLSTFVGDKKANDIYSQLQRQAVYTPFTSAQLLGVERGLIPYKPINQANDATMALANAVAATGGSDYTLERMGWHMQQMAASGHMEAIQRREFAFASIPIMKLLQEDFFPKLGNEKAQAKLMDMEKHGAITYDMVADALEKAAKNGGMFNGALEKLSQTIYGKWTTIKDFWQIGEQKLTLSQRDNIVRLEDQLISGLQKIPEMVSSMAPGFNKAFSFVQEIMPDVKSLLETGWGLVKPVLSLLGSEEVKGLAKSILNLAGDIGHDLIPAVKLAAEALEPLAKLLTRVSNGLDWFLHPKGLEDPNSPAYWINPEHRKQGYDQIMQQLLLAGKKNTTDGLIPNSLASLMPGSLAWYNAHSGGSSLLPSKNGGSNIGGAESAADRITGGGRRNIIVNFNKEVVGQIVQHIANGAESPEKLKRTIEETMLEVFASMEAAG